MMNLTAYGIHNITNFISSVVDVTLMCMLLTLVDHPIVWEGETTQAHLLSSAMD